MVTVSFGLSPWRVSVASRVSKCSNPLTTFPNTTCLPSNQAVSLKHRKNYDPLVFGPELAIDKTPLPTCFASKFSSSNLSP